MLTAQCGTRSGYAKHRKLKEPYCDACKKANNEYSKKYQAANPERTKELAKQSEARRKDKISAYQKCWYQKNKDKVIAQQREYYQSNKEYFVARSAKRRALKLNSKTESYTVKYIIEIYGTVCHICNEDIDMQAPRSPGKLGWEKGLHLDHIIPLSKGGTDTVDNIKPSHGICNLSKGTTVLADVIC